MGPVILKSIILNSRNVLSNIINEVYDFSIKISLYRHCDMFLKKKHTHLLHLIPFVLLQSHLLLCWHGFCDVSVTLCNSRVTLSKKMLDVHPRSDSTELAKAFPIAANAMLISFYTQRLFHLLSVWWKLQVPVRQHTPTSKPMFRPSFRDSKM